MHHFNLKGTGPLTHHLGCTQTRDPDGTLVADPMKYIENILETYKCPLGLKPKKARP